MDWGAALGGLAGGAGSIGGSALSYALSKKEAKRQRRFQERMFRNRYSYTMEDMRNAGLNPILAAKQGPGSAPGGAMAQVPDLGKGLGGALVGAQTALTAQQVKTEKERTRSLELDNDAKSPAAGVGKLGGQAVEAVSGLAEQAITVVRSFTEANSADEISNARSQAEALKAKIRRAIAGTAYEFLVPQHTKDAIDWIYQFYRGAEEDAEVMRKEQETRGKGRGDPLVITPR